MKKRSFLFNGLIVISLVISIAGLSYAQSTRNKLTEESTLTQIMKRGSIRVGFSTFIPWAMKDKKGDFIGFEVEVMQQLAKDMGVKLELVPTKWAGIIPALRTGKFDAIICGMAITPQRNLTVNYTIPYYYSGLTIVANRKLCEGFNPKKMEDFNRPDVVLSERMGVTAVDFIKRTLPKAQIRLFDDASQAYQEVLNGKAHAAINDAPEPAFQAAKFPDQLYMPLGGTKLTKEPLGFALRKGDPDFLNYLNNWITYQLSKPWMMDRNRYWFETRDWEDQIE
jgi:polar amino acid transport system substrate-binding protein